MTEWCLWVYGISERRQRIPLSLQFQVAASAVASMSKEFRLSLKTRLTSPPSRSFPEARFEPSSPIQTEEGLESDIERLENAVYKLLKGSFPTMSKVTCAE